MRRADRAGVQVLTIRTGFVSTPMTAHLPQGPLFASPAKVADGILKAVARRKDMVYAQASARLSCLSSTASQGLSSKNSTCKTADSSPRAGLSCQNEVENVE
jgi:hypothetical protein